MVQKEIFQSSINKSILNFISKLSNLQQAYFTLIIIKTDKQKYYAVLHDCRKRTNRTILL